MAHLLFSREAKRDLVEIFLYVAQDDVGAADRLHERLERACATIAGQPKIGKAREDLREDMRCLPVNNYVIYYRYTQGTVRILRILHGARDVRRLFE